jgi:hypothetical protein
LRHRFYSLLSIIFYLAYPRPRGADAPHRFFSGSKNDLQYKEQVRTQTPFSFCLVKKKRVLDAQKKNPLGNPSAHSSVSGVLNLN